METLESELERARALDEDELADAIRTIGFECTRCGACCKGYVGPGDGDEGDDRTDTTDGDDGREGTENGEADGDPHTATVFPDEVRRLRAAATTDDDAALDGSYDWRDVARPMPYGLSPTDDGPVGETFEWALGTDDCGNCTFYDENEGVGRCAVHDDRPLVCRTYPFGVTLGGTSQPLGDVVEREGPVRAHECEGLGRDMSRADAAELARALKERAVAELEEAVAVREAYAPADPDPGEVVVHDSEGAKRPDGRPYRDERG